MTVTTPIAMVAPVSMTPMVSPMTAAAVSAEVMAATVMTAEMVAAAAMMAAHVVAVMTSSMMAPVVAAMSRLGRQRHRKRADDRRSEN